MVSGLKLIKYNESIVKEAIVLIPRLLTKYRLQKEYKYPDLPFWDTNRTWNSHVATNVHCAREALDFRRNTHCKCLATMVPYFQLLHNQRLPSTYMSMDRVIATTSIAQY